jgi:hypothetical protein
MMMDLLHWFTNLEHVLLLKFYYSSLAALTMINFMSKNNNMAFLFLIILIIGLFESVGGYYLLQYNEAEGNIGYRWSQFLYFSLLNILALFSIYNRRKILILFRVGEQYQLYFQEIGLIIIATVSLIIQLISMTNWLVFYVSGEYSLFIYGLYATIQTILLGLMSIVLFTLTLQNIFGELIPNKKGTLSA